MSRQRWLFDVDGVLADWLALCFEEVHALTGVRYKPDNFNEWNVTKQIAAAHDMRAVDLEMQIYRRLGDLHPRLRPYPGAQDAFRRIADLHEVYIVTAMTHHVESRTAWLREHFNVDPHHIVYTKAKHLVRGDVFVDDHAGLVEAWKAEGHGRGCLFDQPYNRKHPRWSWDGLLMLAEAHR